MTGSIKHFYTSGNTARGFVSLIDSSLQGIEHLYILQGAPGTGKSSFVQSIGNQMALQGNDIWLLHCALDNEALDGMIAPESKLGIIIEHTSFMNHSELPKANLHYVNLGDGCERSQLDIHRSEIEELKEKISLASERAYSGFAEALRIHDDWERIYIANMNYQAADKLTKEYIKILFGDRKQEKKSRVDHRFLGAATPKGAVDWVPNLTEGLKRYLIKGRPGTGKSTMLKKLAAAAIERGFDVEIYHCGFDPNSLDMIIVRELEFAIFDSTAPHEYDPDRDSDEIVDMYNRCIKPGTDEAHAEAIVDIKKRYSAMMKQSIEHLAEAKALQDELAQIYMPFMDFQHVNQIKNEVQQEIARSYLC